MVLNTPGGWIYCRIVKKVPIPKVTGTLNLEYPTKVVIIIVKEKK